MGENCLLNKYYRDMFSAQRLRKVRKGKVGESKEDSKGRSLRMRMEAFPLYFI